MWDYNQFVLWKSELRADGSVNKIPVNSQSLYPADPNDPSNWLSYADAQRLAQKLKLGVGFVFTEHDPFNFIDFDHCRNGAGWKSYVEESFSLLPSAAWEVSQSGQGLHVVCCGTVPSVRRIRNDEVGIELYSAKRFVAFGPYGWQGDPNVDCTAGLQAICARWLASVGGEGNAAPVQWTDGPCSEWSGTTDDVALLQKALMARTGAAIFGQGVTFADLFTRNVAALGQRWPCPRGEREFDFSSADAALAGHLAFWTGRDCARMERLMRMSALVRDKWARADYLQRTILNAVSRCEKVYQQKKAAPELATKETAVAPAGYRFLSIPQQKDYFQGCVYIEDVHRIWVPTGRLLDDKKFNVAYGGQTFALFNDPNLKTTMEAWTAFTKCQGFDFPKVIRLKFNPRLPSGHIGIDDDGTSFCNTWYPHFGKPKVGNPKIFTDHLKRLVPNDEDREIFTSYLAALVQYAGSKFQWAIVLQGAQGNGKTALTKILTYALGINYCHTLNPQDIAGQFNGWLNRKLLIIVEEIRIGQKYALADRLKPYITNDRISIHSKGVDQYTGDNFANWLFCSNHRDAIYKSKNDRRYAVIYTAQQTQADLERAGMNETYFNNLFAWLDNHDGRAIAMHYLLNYPISVNVFGRAPRTGATDEIIKESYSNFEQAILDEIELENIGFRGNFIDTRAALAALRRQNSMINTRTLNKVLEAINYIKHPALTAADGKLAFKGQKIRLYVRVGSEEAKITSTTKLALAYEHAQKGE